MKGPKNAWREREQRKKHIAKIATLKKYAKLVKKEGIVSDRVRLDNTKNREEKDSNQEPGHSHPPKESKKPKKVQSNEEHELNAKKQQNRLTPAEEEKASREEFFAQREAEKQQALQRRKEMHKIMTKRTSKGQPVMAGRIKNILGKLMTEAKK